jgi:hypothetical protein
LGVRPDINRRTFVSLAAGLGALGSAQASSPGWNLPPAVANLNRHWRTTFFEDFRDLEAYEQRWVPVVDEGWGQLVSVRRDENVGLTENGLELRVRSHHQESKPYSAGYVRTRAFTQRYGYFEAEMKIAAADGINNAFWLFGLLPESKKPWFEIDVVEAYYPNRARVSLHNHRFLDERSAKRHRARTNVFLAREDLAASFHRYGALWTEERVHYFLDGALIWSTPNDIAFGPADLRLSNAVGPFAGPVNGDEAGTATAYRSVRALSYD